MLINSDHARWAGATATVGAVAVLGYAYDVSTSAYGPSGGSVTGLVFGITGTGCMVAAGLLSLRKRFPLWRMGAARVWLQMHIWLGVLAIPLILFHAGFRLGGPLTTILMVLFCIVSISGLFGLALQQFLPALMTARVPSETIHGQIDHVMASLAVDAYEQVASATGAIAEATEEIARIAAEEAITSSRPGHWKQVRRLPAATEPLASSARLRAFYLSEVRPYLTSGHGAAAVPDFRTIQIEAPPEWRAQTEKLRQLCDEMRQLRLQVRLHSWLHTWLLLHAPLSFALLVLAAFHIVIALQY